MAFEFFTIILSNSLRKQRLPDKFAKLFDSHDPRELMLREAGRRRRLWAVDVVFDVDGHMYLGHGWKPFARAHDLRLGHFLLLSYDGHAVLTVKVFDRSMCRRDYQYDNDASSGSSSDNGNTLGAEGEWAEEHDVEQRCNPCDLDGSLKDICYSSEELSEDSLSPDNRYRKERSSNYYKSAKMPATPYTSKDFSEENRPSVYESMQLRDLQMPSKDYVLSGKCDLTLAHAAKIQALLGEIRAEIPVLIFQMKKSNIDRAHGTLAIPKDYALKYFPCVSTSIILRLPSKNKAWKRRLNIRPSVVYNPGRRSLYWYSFVIDNHVREGDICVFQPTANDKHRRFVVIVHFLQKTSIESSPGGSGDVGSNYGRASASMVLTDNVKVEPASDGEEITDSAHEDGDYDDSDGASEPLFVAPERTRLTDARKRKVSKKVRAIDSELPICVVVMNNTSVRFCNSGPYLTLAKKYVSKCLENQYFTGHQGKKNVMSLVLQREGKNRKWHTELRLGSDRAMIVKGWTSFARDNHLRVDDICLFKLIRNGETLKMMVYVIRGKKGLA